MIIIKKANAYLYHFGPLECDCVKLHTSEEGTSYCAVVFKINRELLPENKQVLAYVMNLFSQICLDKEYFIPHFYFRIKDIILVSGDLHESVLDDLDDSVIQKLHRQFFYTGNPLQWQEQWKNVIIPASCT